MTKSTPEPSKTLNRYDDEINLAEIIEILVKSKWVILGGSFTCALIVGLYTFLTPRQYQSESLILVSSSIIMTPNSKGNEAAQVSEITLSSLDASTYEVLAKSDELMLNLADTLEARLQPEVLESITEEKVNRNSIAISLLENLEVELLQDTGQRNVFSTTPLLALRYRSTEETVPPIVVNTWSELFMQRNQGLSSNVTDDFYKNVVLQYEQAKNNLERKENELAKIDAASNELNLIKTEMSFKNAQLDSSLKSYQRLQTELDQRTRDYEYTNAVLRGLEANGEWLGYIHPDSLALKAKITGSMSTALIEVINDIEKLYADSLVIGSQRDKLALDLADDHRQLIMSFESRANMLRKREEIIHIDNTIKSYRTELIGSGKLIDSLNTQIYAIKQILDRQAPVLITRKAITDNFLWEHTFPDRHLDAGIQQSLGKYRLLSEETNPVYLRFKQSLADLEARAAFTKERTAMMETNIDSLEQLSINLHKDLLATRQEETELKNRLINEKTVLEQNTNRIKGDMELQLKLRRSSFEDHKAHYESVKYEQELLKRRLSELELATRYYEQNYSTWRDQLIHLSVKVDSLELGRRRIERDVAVYQESFNRFAKLQEEARIARQQAAGDIQVVSNAKLAEKIPRGTLVKVASTATLSLIFFSVLSIVRVFVR